jgi:hypothetical protein
LQSLEQQTKAFHAYMHQKYLESFKLVKKTRTEHECSGVCGQVIPKGSRAYVKAERGNGFCFVTQYFCVDCCPAKKEA